MSTKHPSNEHPPQAVADQIDENLRRVFQEDLNQELPDRFKDLLAQLRDSNEGKDEDPSK
ncbi:MAG: NepR family anti-sigma factor [Pseudomonadota bacterium]